MAAAQKNDHQLLGKLETPNMSGDYQIWQAKFSRENGAISTAKN
jgi:hypothetical protein